MLKQDALKVSFDSHVARATKLAHLLLEQLNHILREESIPLAVPIETRIKDWRSVSEKCKRNKIDSDDILSISDFIGMRVILLFKRDVIRVIEIIERKLKVTSKEDVSERLGFSSFGYQSMHLTAQLPSSWNSVPTFAGFEGFTAEIQVRTAAQHIWAAASHILQYKREASVPTPVLRSINRVAALLETVDLEFERVLSEKADYIGDLKSNSGTHELSEKLNVETLKNILDESIPNVFSDATGDYDELIGDLSIVGISTVGDLKKILSDKLTDALMKDEDISAAIRRKLRRSKDSGEMDIRIQGTYYAFDRSDFEKRGVYHSAAGLVREMIEWDLDKQLLRERRQSVSVREET